tara:strand:- start:961 stop:1725 length:765 start_codon:yes stop_codon:yes gene_type:complete
MFIKIEIKKKIGILTINRPDALNAMNLEVLKELDKSVHSLIKDDDVGVIIITGAGEKAFIAGADIKLMQGLNSKSGYEFARLGQKVTLTIENSPKPVIAAVNGFALGGGCEISLACHMRFASENAMFAQPEVKLGLIPGWGGTQRLPRIVGKGHAIELIIGGQMINVEKAVQIGLVNKVFPLNNLIKETTLFCNLILRNGPGSLKDSLACINDSAGKTIYEGLENEAKVFGNRFETKETSEGLNAFIQKRSPKF